MTGTERIGDITGIITRRLLVNSWVDPDEAAAHLPHGLRPHVASNGGVVAGCCMLEISAARPWPVLHQAGITIRAAAHRISVETGPTDDPTLGVYVPVRHTDSRPARWAGGRAFPGVHLTAAVDVQTDDRTLSWTVASRTASDRFGISTTASLDGADASESEVAKIVIGTTLGLSPNRRGDRLEAVEMVPATSAAQRVELHELESAFLDDFDSAVATDTLLMTDVHVTWKRGKSRPARYGPGL